MFHCIFTFKASFCQCSSGTLRTPGVTNWTWLFRLLVLISNCICAVGTRYSCIKKVINFDWNQKMYCHACPLDQTSYWWRYSCLIGRLVPSNKLNWTSIVIVRLKDYIPCVCSTVLKSMATTQFDYNWLDMSTQKITWRVRGPLERNFLSPLPLPP